MARAGYQALAGRIAIVTGGASGIGRALSGELAARGCTVVLADRQVELAGEVALEIERRGNAALAAALDVRDLAAFESLAEQVCARFGRIDLLFNNAGIGVAGGIDTYAPEDWDDVFDVNLRGVANGVKAVYPIMIEQRSGHIVNTASMAGLVPSQSQGSYTASKHAVVGLTKALRVEAKRFGVRACVLCPGGVRTPILTGGRFGRLKLALTEDEILRLWERFRPMAPEQFARRAIDAVLQNQAVIVLPGWWKALWYLERVSPPAEPAIVGSVAPATGSRACRAQRSRHTASRCLKHDRQAQWNRLGTAAVICRTSTGRPRCRSAHKERTLHGTRRTFAFAWKHLRAESWSGASARRRAIVRLRRARRVKGSVRRALESSREACAAGGEIGCGSSCAANARD